MSTRNWVTFKPGSRMSNEANSTMTILDEVTRRYYLDVMGIQCWELRDKETPSNAEPGVTESGSVKENNTALTLAGSEVDAAESVAADWLQLDAAIQQCSSCQLHGNRKQAIMGRGSHSAELMFVLLAPDSNDDKAGFICSGAADELFSKMLSAINVPINEVYITSLLKCCVPPVHTVSPEEIQHCHNHLIQQIRLVQPKLLVVLGETAMRCLLQENMSLDDYRALNAESHYQIDSVPVFASYSPHELLQKTENKRAAWSDLQQLQKILQS